MPDLQAIFDTLKPLLDVYRPPLVPKTETDAYYDLWSIKDLIIDGRKRKEIYFAALVIQKSYVSFHFMPVYAGNEIKKVLAPGLLKLLEGKSCFHIKQLTADLPGQIEAALRAGFAAYRDRGWV